jgi:hypothetical protein
MGAHGLTGVRKAFFGSTTARVLKRAMVPLLVVPASPDVDKARDLEGLGSILVLSDFGPAASPAAALAAGFAHAIGARLVLVHVMPHVSMPLSECRCLRALQRRERCAETAIRFSGDGLQFRIVADDPQRCQRRHG